MDSGGQGGGYLSGKMIVVKGGVRDADEINTEVVVNNVAIRPGDILLGDATGVVCIPYEHAREAARKSREIHEPVRTRLVEFERRFTAIRPAMLPAGRSSGSFRSCSWAAIQHSGRRAGA